MEAKVKVGDMVELLEAQGGAAKAGDRGVILKLDAHGEGLSYLIDLGHVDPHYAKDGSHGGYYISKRLTKLVKDAN